MTSRSTFLGVTTVLFMCFASHSNTSCAAFNKTRKIAIWSWEGRRWADLSTSCETTRGNILVKQRKTSRLLDLLNLLKTLRLHFEIANEHTRTECWIVPKDAPSLKRALRHPAYSDLGLYLLQTFSDWKCEVPVQVTVLRGLRSRIYAVCAANEDTKANELETPQKNG